MFHPVKILDEKGKIKEVLSEKSLSQKYWDTFFENPAAKRKGKGRRRQPKKGKTVNNKVGMSYEELYFSED